MSVKIRLMRVGKKRQPTYRLVVADGRSPRDGRNIEIIGQYRPREEPSFVQLDGEKALGWLRKGAQPTESAQKVLAIAGVWDTFVAERPSAALKPRGEGRGVGEGAECRGDQEPEVNASPASDVSAESDTSAEPDTEAPA